MPRVGRRGAVLLILFAVDVGVGISFIDPTVEAAHAQNALWRDGFMPSWAWGSIWIFVGVCCLLGALSRQDAIGFGPAVALKIMWASIEITGWLCGRIDQGYRPGLIWLGFAALVYAVAGLREPSRPDDPPNGGPGE
jgi:hypothetical protein